MYCRALLERTIMELHGTSDDRKKYSIRHDREIIKDGINGILYSPRNIAELKARLHLLDAAPSLRSRLGENARATVLETVR